MTATPAELARALRDDLEARAKEQTEQAGNTLAQSEAWATFEHALNGLTKQGCLDTVTITITERPRPDAIVTDAITGEPNVGTIKGEPTKTEGMERIYLPHQIKMEYYYGHLAGNAATPAAAPAPEPPATVKVGDVLQEVIAADLPVGTQFEDCDGDMGIVRPSRTVCSLLTGKAGQGRLTKCGPFTVTYVPPTAPELVVLDRLPDDMAEGSAVLSSERGAMVAFRWDGKTTWRTLRGSVVKDETKLGTLTLLHDAGVGK